MHRCAVDMSQLKASLKCAVSSHNTMDQVSQGVRKHAVGMLTAGMKSRALQRPSAWTAERMNFSTWLHFKFEFCGTKMLNSSSNCNPESTLNFHLRRFNLAVFFWAEQNNQVTGEKIEGWTWWSLIQSTEFWICTEDCTNRRTGQWLMLWLVLV